MICSFYDTSIKVVRNALKFVSHFSKLRAKLGLKPLQVESATSNGMYQYSSLLFQMWKSNQVKVFRLPHYFYLTVFQRNFENGTLDMEIA